MKLGIIADAHLSPAHASFPPVLGFPTVRTEYAMTDDMVRYRLALQRCAREDVDGVMLLGDLSWSGDGESLEAGVRLAAKSGRTVWAVSGNHDCGERVDALVRAVRWVGADNVRLATPEGEVISAGGLRVAGISVTSENWGYTARSDERPDIPRWGNGPVVLLTHYPMISFAEKASRAGLYYGDNDLENLEQVAQPLLERAAPTVVVNGHMHMRDTYVVGEVLQVSCAALTEPPFEITFLELEREGSRISVHIECVPIVSSPPEVRLPVLSLPQQHWVFEAGAWCLVGAAELQEEAAK